MTKTEEALCNGITFSVPRLVPSSIQEGELEDAQYYVYALITPTLDKLVLKIYNAPSYEAIKIKGQEVYNVTYELNHLDERENIDSPRFESYEFGNSYGIGLCHTDCNEEKDLYGNDHCAYNGLLLYSGLKCVMVDTIKEINSLNNQQDENE